MCTRLMTSLVMVAILLLVSVQALAQPQLRSFHPGDVLRANDLNAIVEQIKKNATAASGSGGETHTVDCNAGETIQGKVDEAQPGDTIMIAAGTCNENVVVNKDGITLAGAGQDSTVIDGDNIDASGILVKGQQNVTIKDLTVQNGLIGVHVGLGASAWLENVTAKDSRYKVGHNSGFGILIANSSNAVLTGSIVATGNASNGVIAWQGGRASVVGNLTFEGIRIPQANLKANDNGGHGIELGLSSSLHVQAPDGAYTTLQANNNGGRGIQLGTGSSVQFGGGADIEATGNGESGLWIEIGSSALFIGWDGTSSGYTGAFNGNGQYGIAVFNNSSLHTWDGGIASSITATNNVTNGTGWGLLVEAGSTAFFETPSSETSSKLVLSNNGHGVGVYSNSSLLLRLPAEIKDNANDGIEAWGNAWVESGNDTGSQTMITGNGSNGIGAWHGAGIYLRNAVVTGNAQNNIAAGQGSRLDWSDSQVDDPIYCDPTALAVPFSEASCPGSSDQ